MFAVIGKKEKTGGQTSRVALILAVVATIVAVGAFPWMRVSVADPRSRKATVSRSDANQILTGLLHNVYRSFDHHDDDLIYDRLEKSISGELLSDVYLETRKSMEVKNQGGLRISVKEVRISELEPIDIDTEEPAFRCRWRVAGWIGHWGHTHRRENEHLANITIGARNEKWKIIDMKILDESAVVKIQKDGSR